MRKPWRAGASQKDPKGKDGLLKNKGGERRRYVKEIYYSVPTHEKRLHCRLSGLMSYIVDAIGRLTNDQHLEPEWPVLVQTNFLTCQLSQ